MSNEEIGEASVVLNSATKVHKFKSGKILNEKIFAYK